MADLKWVACGQDLSWSASQHRHLIVKGGLTTLCGHTASQPEVWRGNSKKHDCPTCVSENAKFNLLPAAKKGTPMKPLTQIQTEYLMLVKEQSRRLRVAAEEIQRVIAEETLAALEPDAEVWPGIPSADVLQDLQKAHAKLDLLISQSRMFFDFDTDGVTFAERKALMAAALSGTWKP